MAIGDITATSLGTHDISSAALLTALSVNQGALSAANVTSDIVFIPFPNRQVAVLKLTRSSS